MAYTTQLKETYTEFVRALNEAEGDPEGDPEAEEELTGEEPVYLDNPMALLKDNLREFQEVLQQDILDEGELELEDVIVHTEMPGTAYVTVETYYQGYYVIYEIMVPVGSVSVEDEQINKIEDVYLTAKMYDGSHNLIGKKIDNNEELKHVTASRLADIAGQIYDKKVK